MKSGGRPGWLERWIIFNEDVDADVVSSDVWERFAAAHKKFLGGECSPHAKRALKKFVKKARSAETEDVIRLFGRHEPSYCYMFYRKVYVEIAEGYRTLLLVGVAVDSVDDEAGREEIPTLACSTSEVDMARVTFKKHALEQLQKRYKTYIGICLDDPLATAQHLLCGATEKDAISAGGKVLRLIDNEYEEARYFINGKWRFVVVPEGGKMVVVTIEYAYIK